MVERIIEVFEKYDTDKNSKGHNYGPYYAQHLPESVNKILEVGVHKSESLRAWHEIYPEAHVFGLDLFSEHEPLNESWLTCFRGSQADDKVLDNVRLFGPFDVIVEDGSHQSRHQWMTFFGLVDCCKLYCVEDLQCCENPFWRTGMSYESTMLSMMKNGLFPYENNLYIDKISFIQCKLKNGLK